MTDDATTRLATLEAENFALRSELERLKPPPRVVKLGGPFALPDLEQTERLVRRVFEKYPILRGDIERTFDPGRIEPEKYVTMVRASLGYIGTLHRTRGAVARREYLGWLLEAGHALTATGYPHTDIRGSSFFVACIAAGDVPYSPPRLWPHAEVGLMVGMTRDSYAASNRWLSILAGGDFDAALIIGPAPLRHAPLPPPVNISPSGDWRREL
jgi:hypothetical protein